MKCIFNFLLSFLFLNSILIAQDCEFYYPTRATTNLELKKFDGRGNVKSTINEKIIESFATKDGFTVKVHKAVLDKFDNLIRDDTIQIECRKEGFILDMECYFHDLDLKKYIDNEVRIESDLLIIPKNPKPGLLPSFVTSRISILENGIPIKNMVVNVYFRFVDGYEYITTPAGTFHCLKMNYEVETIVDHKVKSKGIEWFSNEFGLIKRETYDPSGKLRERTILTSMEVVE